FARTLRAADLRIEPRARLMLGEISLARREPQLALEHLLAAEQSEPGLPGLHLKIGQTYLRMRCASEAQRAFERALAIDPDLAPAHEGLATALSRLGERERAVDHALSAVELMHHMPRAHLRLGVTLVRLDLHEQAITAFQTCLKLSPMSPHAHRWLAALYARQGDHPDRAHQHAAMAQQAMAWQEQQKLNRTNE
ncbi:MAG: tetratricopeptide repeat protein, partial [Planctomycetota bacterium]